LAVDPKRPLVLLSGRRLSGREAARKQVRGSVTGAIAPTKILIVLYKACMALV